MALQKVGASSFKMNGHVIPDTNAAYDFGSAEYKIRHLFLSDNSLWVGDNHKISVEGGKKKHKKRKKGIVPTGVKTLLITSVFPDETALKAQFKVDIHNPNPHPTLDPDDGANFNPPHNKWQEFLAIHGHPDKEINELYSENEDFDIEGPDRLTTEGDLLYYDGTDYQKLPIGSAGQSLVSTGEVPQWAASGASGKLLQVVQYTGTQQQLTSSTSPVQTNYQVDITPTSNTSKMLFMASGGQLGDNFSTVVMVYYNNVANLAGGSWGYMYNRHVDSTPSLSINLLHEPATTNQCSYTLFIRSQDGHTVGINPGANSSNPRVNLIVMEIGA